MSRAIKHDGLNSVEIELSLPEKIKGLLPVIAPLALAILFIVARAYAGPQCLMPSDSSLGYYRASLRD